MTRFPHGDKFQNSSVLTAYGSRLHNIATITMSDESPWKDTSLSVNCTPTQTDPSFAVYDSGGLAAFQVGCNGHTTAGTLDLLGGASYQEFSVTASTMHTVTLPDHNSNTVQGIANPSDKMVINYIDTNGVQNRFTPFGGVLMFGCGGTAISGLGANVDLFGGQYLTSSCGNSSNNSTLGMPLAAHTFKNLYRAASMHGLNGSSGVMKVYDASTATAVVATFGTNATASDPTHFFTSAAGDEITIRFMSQVGETLADVRCSLEVY